MVVNTGRFTNNYFRFDFRQMSSNAQDDTSVGGQIPPIESNDPQGYEGQEVMDIPREETQQCSFDTETVHATCTETNAEPLVYLQPGGRVSKHEEIKYLEDQISEVEKCLEKERSDHKLEVEANKRKVDKLEEELNAARNQLRETTRDRDIQLWLRRAKEAELCAKEEQVKAKDAELCAKGEQVKAKDAELSAKDERIRAKDTELCAKDERIKAKDSELCAKDERIKAKDEELCVKDEQIKAKDSALCAKDEQIKSKDEQLKDKDVQLRAKDEQLRSKDVDLQAKDVQLSAKDEQLRTHMSELTSLIERLEAKQVDLTKQQKVKDNETSSRIEELERRKSQLEKELDSKKEAISKLQSESRAKDDITNKLQKEIAIHDERMHNLEENFKMMTSSTNNTGVNITMHNPAKVNIASQNDPAQVVLSGRNITFWTSKELGRGAFATVYEGVFNSDHCAVKVLNQVAMHLISDLPTGPCDHPIQRKGIESFTRECSCLMTIDHPNVVKLIDVRTYDKGNYPVLIMEKLDCSLTDYFSPPNQDTKQLVLLSICHDVASALDYLHQHKIIHRDICGNNVLLNKQSVIPVAKLSDFGMSRILKDFEKMSTTLTAIEGHRAAYYPPELQDDFGSSDSSIDIYMFGVLTLGIAHRIPCVTSRRQRKELIGKLSDHHVLKKAILWCTECEKNKRPTANAIHTEIKILHEEYERKLELKNNPQGSNTNM